MAAAVCGHVAEMRNLYLHVPDVLVRTTPQGNTCLHIAATHGHEVFCKEVQALKPSLLCWNWNLQFVGICQALLLTIQLCNWNLPFVGICQVPKRFAKGKISPSPNVWHF